MDLTAILHGVLPAIAAGLLLTSLGGARWVAAAVAVGLFVAYGLLKQWPRVPTELWSSPNGIEWLIWTVVAAAALTSLEHLRLWTGQLATGSAVALGAFGSWLVLQKVAASWSTADVILHIGGGALVVGLLVLVMRKFLLNAQPGLLPAILVTALLSADAVLLAANGSALLGQLGGGVAAAVGAGLGTSLWGRPFALAGSDGTWIGIAHGLFLLAGVHLAYLPWNLAAIAAAAPLALLLLARKPAGK